MTDTTLTPPEHEHSEAITQAALYLATTPRENRPDRPVIPMLREMFDLSAMDACTAIREADLIRARAT